MIKFKKRVFFRIIQKNKITIERTNYSFGILRVHGRKNDDDSGTYRYCNKKRVCLYPCVFMCNVSINSSMHRFIVSNYRLIEDILKANVYSLNEKESR